MVKRRKILKTGAAVGAASLAGCTDILNGEEETKPALTEFQYFFEDEAGTLGEPAQGQEPPEDAEDWQIVRNTLEESDWEEKQENDVERARGYLAGEATDVSTGEAHEGTVEGIVNRTQELYENPEEVLDSSSSSDSQLLELLQQDDDPVAFTRALVKATDTVTDVASSGGKAFVVPTIAEYAMEELGLDFPEYELSGVSGTEPTAKEDQMVEGSMREGENGTAVGTTGMVHLLSLLSYEKDGELQNKYVENTDARPNTIFSSVIRDPEDSDYRRPIEEGTFTTSEGRSQESWPEHYATAFEQDKLQNMIDMGIEIDQPGMLVVAATVNMIDDGLNDSNSDLAYNMTVSDEIKDQAEDFAVNPIMEKKEKIENFGKMAYSVLETELWENYKGEQVYGGDNPIRIEGSLENPEFYHEPREKFVHEK